MYIQLSTLLQPRDLNLTLIELKTYLDQEVKILVYVFREYRPDVCMYVCSQL